MNAFLVVLILSLSACTSLPAAVSSESDEQIANTRVSLGLKYFQIDNIELARKNLLVAQQLAPNSLSVNYSLAYFYWKSEQYSHAKKYFMRAMEIDSESIMVLNGYAAFLCERGLARQSIGMFRAALLIKNTQTDVNLYLNMARCLKHFGQLSDALIAFKQAMKSYPQNYSSYLDLAEIYLELHQTDNAKDILHRYYYSGLTGNRALRLSLQLANKTNDVQGQLFYQSLLSNQSK